MEYYVCQWLTVRQYRSSRNGNVVPVNTQWSPCSPINVLYSFRLRCIVELGQPATEPTPNVTMGSEWHALPSRDHVVT